MPEPVTTSTTKLALMVGKEVSEAVKERIKQSAHRNKKKVLGEFFDLMLELETEKVKDKRNHDKILHLKMLERLFLDTVMEGVRESIND